jgi:hypothetical protein
MVPWFDSIAYNAVMCSLPRFYSNEGMQPDKILPGDHLHFFCFKFAGTFPSVNPHANLSRRISNPVSVAWFD